MSTKLNALVIDDSGVMRKMVMKGLTDAKLADFEFVEAENGQDALEKLRANDEIDIAFVDWNMPVMTGIDFVVEVHKEAKWKGNDAIPMVMVTSEKTMGKLQEALDQAGADGFISKPFTVDELQRKVKKHIETAQSLRIRRNRTKQLAAAGSAKGQPQQGGWLGKLFG